MIKLRRKRRGVPGLNTSSTADISFMLLIFFLVTTSMEVDMAMSRQMPPYNPDQEAKPQDVDRSKVLTLSLESDGSVKVDDKPVTDRKAMRRTIKDFIAHIGPTHIIELHTNGNASYESYFSLQNDIVRSYRELRDASAKHRFGVPFALCNEDGKKHISDLYPQRVQEVYEVTNQETEASE